MGRWAFFFVLFYYIFGGSEGYVLIFEGVGCEGIGF